MLRVGCAGSGFVRRGFCGVWRRSASVLVRRGTALGVEEDVLCAFLRTLPQREGGRWRGLQHALLTLDQLEVELKELQALGSESAELGEAAEAESLELVGVVEGLAKDVLARVGEDVSEASEGVVLEVSAGVGGQEAMLFSEELFHMYEGYAAFNGWPAHVVSSAHSDLGGLRQGSLSIRAPAAYARLKFESGVHRVQRVPRTERAGRVHTSTVAVAILPLPSAIQIQIHPDDIRLETKRASGPGGQHVNKTESAVRITHLATGITVDSQTQRSQLQNKSVGMDLLRAKLFARMSSSQEEEKRTLRRTQVGLALRSDKIRTYNFPQDRLTDHRLPLSANDVHGLLRGDHLLHAFLNKLTHFEWTQRIRHTLAQ